MKPIQDLDIDALKVVSEGVNALRGPDLGVLVITHYQRILNYIQPDFVHVMMDGRIVESGDAQLALHLEEHGYEWVREKMENGQDLTKEVKHYGYRKTERVPGSAERLSIWISRIQRILYIGQNKAWTKSVVREISSPKG